MKFLIFSQVALVFTFLLEVWNILDKDTAWSIGIGACFLITLLFTVPFALEDL